MVLFSRAVSVEGLSGSVSQNVLKYDLKRLVFVSFWATLTHLGAKCDNHAHNKHLGCQHKSSHLKLIFSWFICRVFASDMVKSVAWIYNRQCRQRFLRPHRTLRKIDIWLSKNCQKLDIFFKIIDKIVIFSTKLPEQCSTFKQAMSKVKARPDSFLYD